MGTRSFQIFESLSKTLEGRGTLTDYIQSQAIVHGFDMDRPHKVEHDAVRRCLVVSQETTDEEPNDEDTEVLRRDSTPIH